MITWCFDRVVCVEVDDQADLVQDHPCLGWGRNGLVIGLGKAGYISPQFGEADIAQAVITAEIGLSRQPEPIVGRRVAGQVIRPRLPQRKRTALMNGMVTVPI